VRTCDSTVTVTGGCRLQAAVAADGQGQEVLSLAPGHCPPPWAGGGWKMIDFFARILKFDFLEDFRRNATVSTISLSLDTPT
jgi:hypothetical protein